MFKLQLLLLAMVAASAQAHTYFAAAPTLSDEVVDFVGYTHKGSFFYNLTTADPALVASAALVVRPAGGKSVAAVTLGAPQPTDAPVLKSATATGEDIDPPSTGYFAPEDIAAGAVKEAVFGGVYDLFQVACKGELFLEVKGAKGATAAAPVEYQMPEHTEGMHEMKTCEEAAQPYKAPAPAPAPVPSASVRTVGSVALAALAPLAALLF